MIKNFLKAIIMNIRGQYKLEINSWVINKNKSKVLVVRFEDSKLNPVKKINEIFNFLELKLM